MSQQVAILFARADSIYKTLPGCDVWDAERDALKWPGGSPIVAHPPCRAWGALRQFAHPMPGERELALWAVDRVREFGGVLEHPAGSTLWKAKRLPRPGDSDQFSGRCIAINQWDFGHRAQKRTWLYAVGIHWGDFLRVPKRAGIVTHVITHAHGKRKGDSGWRPRVTNAEREHTPIELAKWLVEVARRCETVEALRTP